MLYWPVFSWPLLITMDNWKERNAGTRDRLAISRIYGLQIRTSLYRIWLYISFILFSCCFLPLSLYMMDILIWKSIVFRYFLSYFTARCICISAVYAGTRCPSVCRSRSWVAPKRIKISSKFFTISYPHRCNFSIPNGVAMFRREPP